MLNCVFSKEVFGKNKVVALKDSIRLTDDADRVVEVHGGWSVE